MTTDAGPQMETRYANSFKISQNAWEILLDFGQLVPEKERPLYHTRIMVGPALAKVLLDLLGKSMAKYEQDYGTIKMPEYIEWSRALMGP